MKPKKLSNLRACKDIAGHKATTTSSSQLPLSPNIKKAANYADSRGSAINKIGYLYLCSGCNKPIKKDKFLLKACDKYWHEKCLKCDRCHGILGELGSTLYFKSNMNLCRQDYLEMFGQTGFCSVCEKLICTSEMVMRAKQNIYHLECFACQLCNQRFCVGDRFYLCENKVVCQYDYEEHILPIQHSLFQQQQQNLDMEQTNHEPTDLNSALSITVSTSTSDQSSTSESVQCSTDLKTQSNLDESSGCVEKEICSEEKTEASNTKESEFLLKICDTVEEKISQNNGEADVSTDVTTASCQSSSDDQKET